MAELDTEDPVFNRTFLKNRVESAIERYRWHENQIGKETPFIKKLKRAMTLCEQLESALRALPFDDRNFALVDSQTPQLDGQLLEELAVVRRRLEMVTHFREPPRPPGRPKRDDSREFIEGLVGTFYLVDRGRSSGAGSTKYLRLRDFLVICIDQARVQGSPPIVDVKDSAWKHYVEPAITSTRRGLADEKRFYEDLDRALAKLFGKP